MSSTEPKQIKKKVENGSSIISKNTLLPISLVIIIIGSIVYNEVRFAKLESRVNHHLEDPNIHYAAFNKLHMRIEDLENKFATKSEVQAELKLIALKLENIEKLLTK